MSLNRYEEALFNYITSHADERHYWVGKVQTIVRSEGETHQAAARVDLELRRYHGERRASVPSLGGPESPETLRRTSMRNLAEHLMRLWTDPKPKPASLPPREL